jgi:hypothetical protein
MARTNAARRRRRHHPSTPTKAASFLPRFLALVGLPTLIAFSVLNIALRLWDSAEIWWIWLLPLAFAFGAAVTLWANWRPNEVGPKMAMTIGLAWVFVPLMSFGISRRGPAPMPDWGQAAAAMVVIGACVGALVAYSRGRLWLARHPHRVFVDLYASPMLGTGNHFDIPPPPTTDGHYQARCRCGWRGTTRSMDLDTAEEDAAKEGQEHLRLA